MDLYANWSDSLFYTEKAVGSSPTKSTKSASNDCGMITPDHLVKMQCLISPT
jgi:hypothetical protein